MNRVLRALSLVCLSALFLTTAAPVWAQAPATASDFYVQYRKAFDAAKKIEDVLPFMSADTKKQVEATPPAQRPQLFEMVKMMGAVTQVKVTKETRNADGSFTLTVNALDADKKASVGTITIVKEGTAFKLGKESWSTK
jgi:hypothetical protein